MTAASVAFVAVGRRLSALAQTVNNRALCTTRAPFSRLFLVSDDPRWVLSWEMREVSNVARQMGIDVHTANRASGLRRQSVFYASQFVLLESDQFEKGNRVGFAYFHGQPHPDEPDFAACYEALKRKHELIHRVQVSNSIIEALVLESGIDPQKVFRIPIGINLSFFKAQNSASKRAARQRYNLPETAVIIGSFQKDGIGWTDGMQPKRIKGPDVLLKTLGLLRDKVANLFVVLTGPARGYVRAGLEELRIPYRHLYVADYPEVGNLYQALDLYLVTSRDEGGPKAVLESMASGVPLVTTRVGQAVDLVRDGWNGWLVDVDDIEALAAAALRALQSQSDLDGIRHNGLATAEANSYEKQMHLWSNFFHNFIDAK